MCKKKTLTVAIATAISIGSGVAIAGQLQNAYTSQLPATIDGAQSPPQMIEEYGLTGKTVITGEEDGVSYCTELFGDSKDTLELPNGTNTATGIGEYAAVVYTTDGQIKKKFDISFTLTNGAIFSDAPLLGIDTSTSSSKGANANVTADDWQSEGNFIINAATDVANVTKLTTKGTVFQTTAAILYEITAPAGAVSSGTSANYVEFVRLDDKSVDFAKPTAGTPSDIYVVNPVAAANTVVNATANNHVEGTTGNVYILPVAASGNTHNANSFVVGAAGTGFTYSFGGHASRLTAKNATLGNLTLETALPATGGGKEMTVTRINREGDKKIQIGELSDVTSLTGSNTIQFASHDKKYTVTGVETVDASGNGANLMVLNDTLASNLAEGEKFYVVKTQGVVGGGAASDWTTYSARSGTGAGKSTATFEVDMPAASTGRYLDSNSRLAMIYNITKAGVLSSSGQSIEMGVTIKDTLNQGDLNPAVTGLVVAKSQDCLSAAINKMVPCTAKVSVSSGETEFTGSTAVSGCFVNATTITMGYLEIDKEGTDGKIADGQTDFVLGDTGAKASASTLKITEGQFQASAATPGRVYLDVNGTVNLAENVTQTDGKWTAKWELDDTELQAIQTATSQKTLIKFDADKETIINTGDENPPEATLKIDFDDTNTKDYSVAGIELVKIPLDGKICTVYNVPPVGAMDELSLRVTNESSSTSTLTGTMWHMDGSGHDPNPLFTDEELVFVDGSGTVFSEDGTIGAWQTKRISAEAINKVLERLEITGEWSGRAVLQIKSTLPKMEVFALLRNRVPGSPLTNLSLGATGNSCND